MRWLPIVSACLLTCWVAWTAADALDSSTADEQTLKAANLAVDGPALLDFFRKKTLSPVDKAKIKHLVQKMGDNSFQVREKASADLVALGGAAEACLREARNDPDIEIVRRAENCLRLIQRGLGAAVPAAAARIVAKRKPAGAAEVLLAYLPTGESEGVGEEIRTALAAVAVGDGKPEPVLVAALTDKAGWRRGAAGEALTRANLPALRPEIRKLLKDPDAAVRHPVALALVYAKEKEAVPVLIDLLGDLSWTQMGAIEDLLCRLAEEKSPLRPADKDDKARITYRQAWADWWRDHEAKVDLAKLDEASRMLGYTLVLLLDAGRAIELTPDGKPRWQIDGLQFPLDAQVLPGDRLLAAENHGNRVTERNRKGEVLWEKKIEAPLMAQRLANGNTFIASQAQIVEVDREGKEVFTLAPQAGQVFMKAVRLKNGDIATVLATNNLNNVERRYARLDRTGKELKSFPVSVRTSGGRLDVLPDGRVLIAQMAENKVVEYDAAGKQVWEATVEQPIAAVRLPNGNTLVTSMSQNRAVEIDRAGKEKWEYKSPVDSRVNRAFRR